MCLKLKTKQHIVFSLTEHDPTQECNTDALGWFSLVEKKAVTSTAHSYQHGQVTPRHRCSQCCPSGKKPENNYGKNWLSPLQEKRGRSLPCL